MEDQERETASTEAELKEDELELSLGLRPAPSIGQISHLSKPKCPVPEGSGDLSLSVPIWGKSGAGSDLDSEGLGFEMEAKKEAQALRRQEARKKREGKRKPKANAFSGNSDSNADDFSKRRRLGDQRTIPEIPATTSFLGRPYYTMMPGLVQPATVGAGGFRPYLAAEKNSGDVKQSVSGCSRGSSPGVSDHRSTSGQGGSSSDGGSHSSHSNPLIEPSETLKTATDSPNMKSSDIDKTSSVQPKTSSESSVVVNQSKPPKPPTQKSNESVLLSEMPCVSTTGNGPNGKTITGFLYKYTQSEVCIVCVCHGSFLTPAGFVEHAGGVDVHNPLRHITVVPFTVT